AVEQAKFYELFEQYLAELREPLVVETPQQSWDLPPWLRYLFLVAILSLLGYITYAFLDRPEPKVELAVFIDGPPYASEGDTVTFMNRSRYAGDSTELRWQWQYYDVANERVELVDSLQFNWTFVVPPTAGNAWYKEVRLAVYHPREDSVYFAYRPFAIFCPNPPALDRISGPRQTEVGSLNRFTAEAAKDVLDTYRSQGREYIKGAAVTWTFTWDFGDGTVDSNGTYFAQHRYAQNGQYLVRLTARDTTGSGICETTQSLEVRVGSEKAFLPPIPLQRDKLEPLAIWGWGYYLFLALIGLAVTYYWVRYLAGRRQQPDAPDEAWASPREQALKARFSLDDRAPYFIPLRDQSDQIVVDPQQLRLADALRLRQEDLRKQIDVPATLQATIDKGGFPEVRFRYATRPSEYLFLVDEQSRASHLGQLFKHLVSLLREQDVHAETFYYRQHFTRFWNSYHPDGLSLEQLYNSYGEYRLVVLGDLHELIDPTAAGQPQLRVIAMNVLRGWSQRLLLTPVPPVSWSYREKLLARIFQPFPADADGLGEAALFLENDGDHLADNTAYEAWKQKQIEQRYDLDTEHRNWRRWPAIKEYLNSYSAELVTWFQA
ncbi:MAG: PKD domain-containing protein, partial [Bacteroidetes bacterium]